MVSAINPAIPEDWLLENLLVFFLVALLAATYRIIAFSDLSSSVFTSAEHTISIPMRCPENG